MNVKEVLKFSQDIVRSAKTLKDKHTNQTNAPVNYICIFSQSQNEYQELRSLIPELGTVRDETATGPVIQIEPLETAAGVAQLLKLRAPDPARKERGDADFTVKDFASFKSEHLGSVGFKLIEREAFEMVELIDTSFDVIAYFSHPALNVQLGITPFAG